MGKILCINCLVWGNQSAEIIWSHKFQMCLNAVKLGCCFLSLDQRETEFACLKYWLVFLMETSEFQCLPFPMNTNYSKAAPSGWHSRLVLSALFFRQHSWQAGSNTGRRNGLITVTLFSKSMGIAAPCKYTNCLGMSWGLLRLDLVFPSEWSPSCSLCPACKSYLVVIMVIYSTDQNAVWFFY